MQDLPIPPADSGDSCMARLTFGRPAVALALMGLDIQLNGQGLVSWLDSR